MRRWAEATALPLAAAFWLSWMLACGKSKTAATTPPPAPPPADAQVFDADAAAAAETEAAAAAEAEAPPAAPKTPAASDWSGHAQPHD